ncbi:MAG TPA: SIMPL domain-containing protein [Gemmatimonadales bacterium]|nr:SIMPL domain-containing protein [Gemmatimonadales bacterium]
MNQNVTSATIVALGVALAGLAAGAGFARGRATDRYVEVKGVAERDVSADLALWPLRVTAVGNDLIAAEARIAQNTAQVYAFLRRHGIDTAQADLQGLDVTDAFANPYGGPRPPQARYILSRTIMVRSEHVDVVLTASASVGELVAAGVVLSGNRTGFEPSGPTFLFTKLNELKPVMLKEAVASAREAADQFAADSRSELGGIRQASQGVFVILPRDQAPGITEPRQVLKTVRVVSTVQYYLKGGTP